MATKRKADCTPEEYERIKAKARINTRRHQQTDEFREKARNYRKKKREEDGDKQREYERNYYAKLKEKDPEKVKAINRKKYLSNPERYRRADRRRIWRKAKPYKARKLLLELQRLAPRYDNRDDIISEAYLLVMQGYKIEDALKQAKTTANRFNNELRYNTTNLEDCFWL